MTVEFPLPLHGVPPSAGAGVEREGFEESLSQLW